MAQDRTVFCDGLDMSAGDEQGDRLPAVAIADVQMTEPAQIANGDLAAGVQTVATDSVLKR